MFLNIVVKVWYPAETTVLVLLAEHYINNPLFGRGEQLSCLRYKAYAESQLHMMCLFAHVCSLQELLFIFYVI